MALIELSERSTRGAIDEYWERFENFEQGRSFL